MQVTTFPEAAQLLKHPPYKYRSKNFSPTSVSVAELLQLRNSPANAQNEENECSDDMAQVFTNLGSMWALQMLDADAKPSSGILKGGFVWPGYFGECNEVYAPEDSEGHGDFHGQFCVASWSIHLPNSSLKAPLTTGLCIPDSCTANGMDTAMTNILHILERLPILKKLSSLLFLDGFICKLNEKSMDAAGIVTLTFLLILVALVVIGSSVTIWDHYVPPFKNRTATQSTSQGSGQNQETTFESGEISVAKAEPNSSTEGDLSSGDKATLTTNMENGIQIQEPLKQKDSVLKNVALCFSAFRNGAKILDNNVVEGQLMSIHGIRFFSLSWIILGHSAIMAIALLANALDLLRFLDLFIFQGLLQVPFAVDSFFLLSGFLLAYLFLKEADKKNGKINWVYFYFHRFWRLTPAYMVVVFFYMFVFKYTGFGPFWDDNYCDADRGTWWWYLIYINNFIPIHDMCIGWSWYLANDMQFYLISPLFLYPLWRWPKIGFGIIASFLVGTWVATGILSHVYDVIPMFTGLSNVTDIQGYEDKMWDSFDLIYDKPYCRIAPYLIGILLGYALYKTKQRKNFMTIWQQVLGWCVSAFCILSVVFGLYHVNMSSTTSVFYNAFSRSTFAVGLAWVIFACETGHGGFITKFLAARVWIIGSRLSYSCYLIHPILIHGFFMGHQTTMFFSGSVILTNFFGFFIASYIFAFFFSLIFESPMMNLEKLLLKRRS